MNKHYLLIFNFFAVGFGHVYLVKKRGGVDDSKEYAMKLVYRDGHTDKEYEDAFENEFNVRNAWIKFIRRMQIKYMAFFLHNFQMFKVVRGARFLIQMKYAIIKSSFFYYVLGKHLTR